MLLWRLCSHHAYQQLSLRWWLQLMLAKGINHLHTTLVGHCLPPAPLAQQLMHKHS